MNKLTQAVTIREADTIWHEAGGWFDARWHFSFDRYRDPEQNGVGALRVFNDDRIVAGAEWPLHPHRDIETITTELVLADLEAVKKRIEKGAKDAKRGDKVAVAEEAVLKKLEPVLDSGKPALTVELTSEEKIIARGFYLMTDKPTIFACNVKESDLATANQNQHVLKVREYVKTHLACDAVVISAQIESDLIDLSMDEAKAFLKELLGLEIV